MQSYATHRRFYPLFHFVAMPIFAANLVIAGVHWYRVPTGASAWLFVLAFGLLVALGVGRGQAITVQDRVIRLEERLRLHALAPQLAGRIDTFTKRQLVALRFASDAELPDLARRVLAGELAKPGDIKRAVTTWRPDHLRA
jgi:Family of unknown function (DUF6526)